MGTSLRRPSSCRPGRKTSGIGARPRAASGSCRRSTRDPGARQFHGSGDQPVPARGVPVTARPAGPVETEWQFDAIDVRPVERWLAALPQGVDPTVEPGRASTILDTYLD